MPRDLICIFMHKDFSGARDKIVLLWVFGCFVFVLGIQEERKQAFTYYRSHFPAVSY